MREGERKGLKDNNGGKKIGWRDDSIFIGEREEH